MTRNQMLTVLWAIVVLEIISPVPLVLTIGAVYVLAARPPWFRKLVADLYSD